MKRSTPLKRTSSLKPGPGPQRKPMQKGRRKAQKDPRFRSERYLRFVRSLPCSACGVTPCDAHHVIGLHWGLSGMSTTAPDSYAMPLCRACHMELHREPGWLQHQPRWLRHTIALGMQEFDGEIHEALREALEFINARDVLY